MNTTTKSEQSALAVPPATEAGALALITLSPEKYAAEVYQPFKDQLLAAIEGVRAINYDIDTTAGMATAIKCRATFRDLRIAADKERKARKEPITKIGKLLESSYDLVEERVTPLEEMFDADIKAEETRKAEAKAAKEKAEQERIDAIYVKIDKIRMMAAQAVGASSDQLIALLADCASREITTDEFSTLAAKAQVELDAVTVELQTILTKARAAEFLAAELESARLAEVARIEAEKIALAEQKAANERAAGDLAAERKRMADEAAKLEAAAKARQAEADAKAKSERDEQAKAAAAQQAIIDAQIAAMAEQSRKLAEQQAAADARDAAAAKRLADEVQCARDHGPALMMNAEFDVARDAALAAEVERARLQAMAEQAQDDVHQPMPNLDALMDDVPGAELGDDEIIDMVAAALDMTRSEAIDRLQAIDFDAARVV